MVTSDWAYEFFDEDDSELSAEINAEEAVIAPIESRLRHNILHMPEEIQQASGIVVYGRRIKSLLFSTDVAVIRNCDADAIFCVYPFTSQRAISAAVIHAAAAPVFCGTGGAITQGMRAVYLSMDAENQGAMGVVFNAPIPNRDLRAAAQMLDIPIVVTVVSEKTDVKKRVESGASILNVAAGVNTPELVAKIRAQLPQVPIMASGGKTPESILTTIRAGANAIVYTPPSPSELMGSLMARHREEL